MLINQSGIFDNQKRGALGGYLKDKITVDAEFSCVSAFFTIYAYGALKEQLNQIKHMRFLFGEPRFILDPTRSDLKAFNIEDQELRLSNRLQQKAIARECAQWLEAKTDIRSMIKPSPTFFEIRDI